MANVNRKLIESLTVREASADDEKIINDFFDRMGAESRSVFNRRDYNRRGILKSLSKEDKTRVYFLALIDGEVAGYFFFMDWHFMIPELGIAVRDDLAGQGVGTHLVALAKDMALMSGKGGIQLTTHVANLRAQTLYESAGFACKGVCKNGTELFYLLSFKK